MATLDEQGSKSARLTLEIWHPDCWTLEVTEDAETGLIAHTVSNGTDGRVKGHFTAYGESTAAVESLVDATRRSPLTSSVSEMQRRYEFEHHGLTSGYTTKELFVEYDPSNTISDGLLSQGFIQDAPVRVRNGLEYWSVFVEQADRDELHDRLDVIREEYDADISVTKIYSHETRTQDVPRRVDALSERQREIYELACEQGYYTWPRECTTRELADAAGIAKTTLLEHLRKAEAKLLNPKPVDSPRSL
ncbi:helix-turn-helix domain-containing protein [Halobacteria archaeon AArc-curdl1]|uniref:Helix-turn-helix domain-containing protein n=1 Tax=Natronosalvus hydrolyticus TaxID=2979988 RepID=A0AAP3E5F9_9EURY|nr:helix-turn-helix domain-containing protein [Halobacteria archaeon AArc-curdl1]